MTSDNPTTPGHHARLCHWTFARMNGWWGCTQPSHLGPQAAAAPTSLCLTPSRADMAGRDVVTALYGTTGCPEAAHAQGWQQSWGGSTAIKPPGFETALC